MQVGDGSADVRAVVKTVGDFVHAGGAVAKSGCWSMLKGGLTAASSGPAEIYFEVVGIRNIFYPFCSRKMMSRFYTNLN